MKAMEWKPDRQRRRRGPALVSMKPNGGEGFDVSWQRMAQS